MIHHRSIEDAVILSLDHGSANALDVAFLREIRDALDQHRDDPPRGLILTGEQSMFCAGLDLRNLAKATRDDIAELMQELRETLVAVFTFPRPCIAAINGHAIAGGALLALACDQRIMAEGKGKFGLTESQLGLVVPRSAIEMVRYALPRPVLEKLLYAGNLYPTFKVLDMQVLDAVVEPEQLLDRCYAAIVQWTPSPSAFGDIKARLHAPTVAAIESAVDEDARFVDRWFTDETQEKIAAAVQQLEAPQQG